MLQTSLKVLPLLFLTHFSSACSFSKETPLLSHLLIPILLMCLHKFTRLWQLKGAHTTHHTQFLSAIHISWKYHVLFFLSNSKESLRNMILRHTAWREETWNYLTNISNKKVVAQAWCICLYPLTIKPNLSKSEPSITSSSITTLICVLHILSLRLVALSYANR